MTAADKKKISQTKTECYEKWHNYRRTKKKIHKSDNFEDKCSVLSSDERLFYLSTSDINKAYSLFLVYVSPAFDKFT